MAHESPCLSDTGLAGKPNTRTRARLAPLAVCILAWLTVSTSPAARAQSLELELTEFQSRAYTVRTNAAREEVRPFAEHMDRVFAEYEHRFRDFRSRREIEMPLILLRTQEQYHQFMAERDIGAENTGGMFFLAGEDSGLVTWIEDRPHSQTFEVLQHEGFHQFAHNYIGQRLPIWVNEGLAQYFQDGIIVDRKMKVGLADAQRIERVQHALENDGALEFEELIGIDHQQWTEFLQNSPERAAILYAQSWSVVYFLIHGDGGRYRGAFNDYLQQLSRGRSNEQAFKAAFGSDDLTAAQARWQRFAQNQKPDPLNTALARLQFLGQALRYMHQNDEPMPTSLDQLREYLQKRRFRLTRRSHAIETTYKATDDEMYHFTRRNGTRGTFELLAPSRNGLPPRITARGLDPQPTLIWSRNDADKLVQDVRFR